MGEFPSGGAADGHVKANRKLSREEQANLELRAMLSSMKPESSAEIPTSAAPASLSTTPTSRPDARTAIESTRRHTAGDSGSRPSPDISPESLFPSEMSCREAFDSAFYCQSPGGQFINVYRYGTLKDCSEHWGAFWFCMRNKSYKDAERRRRVRSHYHQRAAKYKTGPSSEDIWEARTEPLEGAFQQVPHDVGGC
ncbi:MAG: hypothetical protein M1815_003833 [Lichina confinis]|nr:MAG: hypothetical protein M1815_003833 [Lichina confinis]